MTFFVCHSMATFAYAVVWGDLMNSCELTASITAVANGIACKLSNEDLTLLGVILTQLGDTITTIAVQREICEKKN